MRVSLEAQAPGVDPDRALAWWTDLRSGHEDHAFVPGAQRRLTRLDETTVRVHDQVRWLGLPVYTERYTAQTRGNTVQLAGENPFAGFTGRYRFEHTFDPDGTLVTLEATIDLKGPLAWFEALARPIVRWILRWDTDHHVDDMLDDLAPSTAGRPGGDGR